MTLDSQLQNDQWVGEKDALWPPEPNRDYGLKRLNGFIEKAGRHYQTHRNGDFGRESHTNVSVLSPYLRHRIISETEVLQAVLSRHSPSEAFKFVQEVFWRSYWKGWLEHRSHLWPEYHRALPASFARWAQSSRALKAYEAAIGAQTQIPIFNEWCEELKETGYLHNHARMWFASIWVFTLRLPWQLGADFFVRHLLDGDPASNTLGWRWVAGLHTVGKCYLATAKNIRTCAEQRLMGRTDNELGLNRLSTTTFTIAEQLSAEGLQKTDIHWCTPETANESGYRCNKGRTALLVTEEDLTWVPMQHPDALVALSTSSRSALADNSAIVHQFVSASICDAVERISDRPELQSAALADQPLGDDALVHWLTEQKIDEVLCAYVPIGPIRLRLDTLKGTLACKGISLRLQMRDYDRVVWPHTSKGFFQLGKKIPDLLSMMNLAN